MTFNVYGGGKSERDKESNIDFDALNRYVVETAELQERTVLAGTLVGLVDIGLQAQEDAEVVFTGDEEDEAAEIEKFPGTYFEDGIDPKTKKPARMKRWPQKPMQAVVPVIEFGDIMLQKGQFFGDEDAEPKPLRMFLGDQFYTQSTGMIVARPTFLKVTKNTHKQWSFAKTHLFYKMAQASKLVDPTKDEAFLPENIDKLLGKTFQFEVQIFMKPSGDKEYYTERIKYIGALSRGQKAAETDTEPFVVEFNSDNSVEVLRELRGHVKNTIKRAKNYEGSKIQAQLEALGNSSDDSKSDDAQEPEEKKTVAKSTPPKKVVKKSEPVVDDDPDGAPF